MSRMSLHASWHHVTHYDRNVSWIKFGMSASSRWRGPCNVVVTELLLLKMSLYSVLRDWTNRELWESNNRLSIFGYSSSQPVPYAQSRLGQRPNRWPSRKTLGSRLNKYEIMRLLYWHVDVGDWSICDKQDNLFILVNLKFISIPCNL